MTDFIKVYKSTAGKRKGVDHSILRPLLERVYLEVLRVPTDRSALKEVLSALLHFLTSPSGQKSEYYYAVDDFFSDYYDKWIPDTSHLTEYFRTILDEMCWLHGALEQPEYHAKPEEILALVDKITVDDLRE